MTTINATDANAGRNRFLLLDVRTPGEFGSEHVEGAMPMPLDRLDPAAVRTLTGNFEHCVVICQGGKRASMAAERLTQAGLENISVLEGGLEAWKRAGLPVIRGRGVIAIERQVRIAAGTLVLFGVGLGVVFSPACFGIAAFVGAGLVFAGITDFCGMGLLLARMPWNRNAAGAN